jgi:hypothetical protein
MKCDSQASFLTCTFASPCLGRKPKANVATPSAIFFWGDFVVLASLFDTQANVMKVL